MFRIEYVYKTIKNIILTLTKKRQVKIFNVFVIGVNRKTPYVKTDEYSIKRIFAVNSRGSSFPFNRK